MTITDIHFRKKRWPRRVLATSYCCYYNNCPFKYHHYCYSHCRSTYFLYQGKTSAEIQMSWPFDWEIVSKRFALGWCKYDGRSHVFLFAQRQRASCDQYRIKAFREILTSSSVSVMASIWLTFSEQKNTDGHLHTRTSGISKHLWWPGRNHLWCSLTLGSR